MYSEAENTIISQQPAKEFDTSKMTAQQHALALKDNLVLGSMALLNYLVVFVCVRIILTPIYLILEVKNGGIFSITSRISGQPIDVSWDVALENRLIRVSDWIFDNFAKPFMTAILAATGFIVSLLANSTIVAIAMAILVLIHGVVSFILSRVEE